MDPKFQTSFIPKKQQSYQPFTPVMGSSLTKQPRHGSSVFMSLAIVIFVLSLGSLAGVYFWKQYLETVQVSYKTELAQREKNFDIALIERLKKYNIQIDKAKSLLVNHTAVSQLFEKVLQAITVSKVRFLSMDFKGPSLGDNGLSLNMKGYGGDLAAVAFQSDVLAQLSEYKLSNVVKNPILNDPTIDLKGVVSFGLSASIDPESMRYEQLINPSEAESSTAPISSSSPSIR